MRIFIHHSKCKEHLSIAAQKALKPLNAMNVNVNYISFRRIIFHLALIIVEQSECYDYNISHNSVILPGNDHDCVI